MEAPEGHRGASRAGRSVPNVAIAHSAITAATVLPTPTVVMAALPRPSGRRPISKSVPARWSTRRI
jgi:hypothetical protein